MLFPNNLSVTSISVKAVVAKTATPVHHSPTRSWRYLRDFIEEIKPYCTEEGLKVLEKEGLYRYDTGIWLGDTHNRRRMCAYGFRDQQGIIKCGIEQAYLDKKITWKKPTQLSFVSD